MTMDAFRLIRLCSVCRNKAFVLCQRCKEPYCSQNCQILDWPNHKAVCVFMPPLVKAADFGIPNFPAVNNFEAGLQSEITPLIKPKAATYLGVNDKTDVVMPAKPFQQINPNFPSKTESEANPKTTFSIKDAFEVKADKSINDSFAIRNSEFVDQSEEIKNAPTVVPTKSRNSQQSDHHTLEREKISPEIRAMTIPKPVEMEEAPPQEMKKTPSAEIQQVTIPKQVEMEVTPKPIKLDPSQKLLEMEASPKHVITSALSALAEPWMKPLPIEETGFVSVVVQFIPMNCSHSQTAWVMLDKNGTESFNLLREINKNVKTAPNVEREEIKVNQLYRVPFEGLYYRGVVVEPVTSDDLVMVRLIDYGNELKVPIGTVKAAIPIMKTLPAFGFQIKFQAPREVAVEEVLKIKVKSTGDENIMNVIVEGEVAYATRDDLETVPIPIGTRTKLYCLDYSNTKKGYIAACVYDIKAIAGIEGIDAKMSEYARSTDSYNPQLNELCLALYDNGEWYRAVNGKVIDSNTFGIVFIDYGNLEVVKSSNIRKMPDEFMHHCLMNKCYVKGAPEKPTDADIQKMVSYFCENQVFTIEGATKEKAGYMIHVPELHI